MDAEVKKQWVKALRSGNYKQTNSCLRDNKGFCCLGVLINSYLLSNGNNLRWELYHFGDSQARYYVPGLTYEFGDETLPKDEIFELWCGEIDSVKQATLAHFNDTEKWNFNQIADWIEANL